MLSIDESARHAARSTSCLFAAMGASILTVVGFVAVQVVSYQIISQQVASNQDSIVYSLRLGDDFSVRRKLAHMGVGASKQLILAADDKPFYENKSSDNATETLSSFIAKKQRFGSKDFQLFARISFPLGQIGDVDYSLETISSLSIPAFLVVGSIIWAILFVWLQRILQRRLVRFGKEIAEPIKSLIADISNGETNEASETSYSVREINELAQTFHEEQLARRAYMEELGEARRYQAVAQTTQMLAHDVRGPFMTLKAGLGLISKMNTMAEVKGLTPKLLSQVERSLVRVNRLVADVMEMTPVDSPSLSPKHLSRRMRSGRRATDWPFA